MLVVYKLSININIYYKIMGIFLYGGRKEFKVVDLNFKI